MTWWQFFIVLFVGAALGAAALYKFYAEGYVAAEKLSRSNFAEAAKKIQLLMGAAESIYSLEFGGYGTVEDAKIQAYNKLWKLIGKQERGKPPA